MLKVLVMEVMVLERAFEVLKEAHSVPVSLRAGCVDDMSDSVSQI